MSRRTPYSAFVVKNMRALILPARSGWARALARARLRGRSRPRMLRLGMSDDDLDLGFPHRGSVDAVNAVAAAFGVLTGPRPRRLGGGRRADQPRADGRRAGGDLTGIGILVARLYGLGTARSSGLPAVAVARRRGRRASGRERPRDVPLERRSRGSRSAARTSSWTLVHRRRSRSDREVASSRVPAAGVSISAAARTLDRQLRCTPPSARVKAVTGGKVALVRVACERHAGVRAR